MQLPRILVIDDMFGRRVHEGFNMDRSRLCGQYLLLDVTGDEHGESGRLKVNTPVAEAVFFRGQKPVLARVGDTVENDIDGTLDLIREGWFGSKAPAKWSLVLLDLCFYTGSVTIESNERQPGMPRGLLCVAVAHAATS